MYPSLRCGFLTLLGVFGFASTAVAEKPMPRFNRWAAQRLERAGRSTAIAAADARQSLVQAVRRAADAGIDSYLTCVDYAEIQIAQSSAAEAPPDEITPRQYLERAWERVQAGQHDAALADANACLRLAPRHAGAWFLRGEIWLFKKKFYRAVHDLDRSVQYHPFIGSSYEMRARARLELGDKPGALDDAKKVVLLGPRAAAFYFRASIRSRLGDFQGALDDLNEAIEREPDDAFYLEVRGSVHHRLGDYDAAIADCDRAIELDPELAVAYFVRAMAKQAKREFDAADADFQIANGLAPESFPLTKSPREPSLQTKSPREASPSYGADWTETSVGSMAHPNRISELYKIAWRSAASPDERYRDGIRAVEAALEACKLSEFNDPRCIEALAAACAECGEFAGAVRYQTRAIELRDEQSRSRLGQRPDKSLSSLLDLDGAHRDERLERLERYRSGQTFRDER